MIYTMYNGMNLGGYRVVKFVFNQDNNIIKLKLLCINCKEYKEVTLKYESILKIKCRVCGRLDVVIPINYIRTSKVVSDTITIGAYKYRKLKSLYNKSAKIISEIDYLRQQIFNELEINI